MPLASSKCHQCDCVL